MALYWDDSFEGGNGLSNWTDYGLGKNIFVTSGQQYTGSQSVAIPYPNGGYVDRFLGQTNNQFNIRFALKLSPGFITDSTGTKIIYIRCDQSPGPYPNGSMNMIFGGRVLHFIMQGAYDSGDTENISLNITLTESWQEIEWQWIMNTPGQANGSMAAWLGTTQVFSQTGREYRGPNPGTVASDGLNNGSNNHVNNVRLYAQFGQGTIYLDRVATGNTRIGTTGQSPPLTLSPSTQPSGQVSVPYLGTTVTADGIAPRTFSASGLPPGVLLSTTGAWSGTPSAPGTFSTLVGATDSSVPARQGSITYPIVINPVAGDINTRNKRESSYSIAFPCFRVRPLPDGSLATTADRTHMAYQYAGITPVMAGPINTRNKRQSCYSLAFPAFRVRPNPDGSLANADDRTHMAYEYAGITTAAIPPGGRDGTIGRGTFKGIGLGMR